MHSYAQATLPKHADDAEYVQDILERCQATIGQPVIDAQTGKVGRIVSISLVKGVVTLRNWYPDTM